MISNKSEKVCHILTFLYFDMKCRGRFLLTEYTIMLAFKLNYKSFLLSNLSISAALEANSVVMSTIRNTCTTVNTSSNLKCDYIFLACSKAGNIFS